MAFSSVLFLATCAYPQPQSPDLKQLKDKLQRLEQEMQELKGQINAVEDAQKPTAAPSTASVAQPGATEIVPKETSPKTNIDLYGFVMLDSGYGLGAIKTDRHADERD